MAFGWLESAGAECTRGRPGRVEGTRELVFAPLPVVAVYEVHEEVHVLRIQHGSQQWPSR
jgi:toxin ParE1/3/4